jgi:hypothetical protein
LAGGRCLLIGDGYLNYSNERIPETYYAFAIEKNLTLTADYQLRSPTPPKAPNAVRSPSSRATFTASSEPDGSYDLQEMLARRCNRPAS